MLPDKADKFKQECEDHEDQRDESGDWFPDVTGRLLTTVNQPVYEYIQSLQLCVCVCVCVCVCARALALDKMSLLGIKNLPLTDKPPRHPPSLGSCSKTCSPSAPSEHAALPPIGAALQH